MGNKSINYNFVLLLPLTTNATKRGCGSVLEGHNMKTIARVEATMRGMMIVFRGRWITVPINTGLHILERQPEELIKVVGRHKKDVDTAPAKALEATS